MKSNVNQNCVLETLDWQQCKGRMEGAQFRKQANKLGNWEEKGIAKGRSMRRHEEEPLA